MALGVVGLVRIEEENGSAVVGLVALTERAVRAGIWIRSKTSCELPTDRLEK